MVLSNAERQKRYREKRNELARAATSGELTSQQVEDRQAVMSLSLFPIVATASDRPRPRFMGLDPNQWRNAPDELVDHFGMREARSRWNDEWTEHKRRVELLRVRSDVIIARVGARAKKIARDHGNVVLCRAYDIDPNLGPEALKSVT